jgi:hypothetical protein
LLGYTRVIDNPRRYTISREKHVQANAKFADAVLGEFGPGRWTGRTGHALQLRLD